MFLLQDALLSSLNAYLQQSRIEPINIRHGFYAKKIQQITEDLISVFSNQTSEEQIALTDALSKTLDHLTSDAEYLDEENLDLMAKLKILEEEISAAREYSMADSLVREQIKDLTRQQTKYAHQQDWIVQMKNIVKETYDHLHALLPDHFERDDSRRFFEQLKQNGLSISLSISFPHRVLSLVAHYQRLSKGVSPPLLQTHQMISAQELIPTIPPLSRHLFQIPIETRIEEEIPAELFLIENQSIAISQTEEISTFDRESQIRLIQINYLRKQQAQAFALGDVAQQLAAEQAIASKLPVAQPEVSVIRTSDSAKLENQPETSMTPSIVHKRSLVDQQIRGLVKKHVKSLQDHIRTDPSEPLDRKTIHSLEDLRRLSIFLPS